MNWRVKALCQLGLSVAPLGETANYYAQRYVTGNAALSYHFLRVLRAKAANHIDAMHSHLAVPLSQALVYQFGAGWELDCLCSYGRSGSITRSWPTAAAWSGSNW